MLALCFLVLSGALRSGPQKNAESLASLGRDLFNEALGSSTSTVVSESTSGTTAVWESTSGTPLSEFLAEFQRNRTPEPPLSPDAQLSEPSALLWSELSEPATITLLGKVIQRDESGAVDESGEVIEKVTEVRGEWSGSREMMVDLLRSEIERVFFVEPLQLEAAFSLNLKTTLIHIPSDGNGEEIELTREDWRMCCSVRSSSGESQLHARYNIKDGDTVVFVIEERDSPDIGFPVLRRETSTSYEQRIHPEDYGSRIQIEKGLVNTLQYGSQIGSQIVRPVVDPMGQLRSAPRVPDALDGLSSQTLGLRRKRNALDGLSSQSSGLPTISEGTESEEEGL